MLPPPSQPPHPPPSVRRVIQIAGRKRSGNGFFQIDGAHEEEEVEEMGEAYKPMTAERQQTPLDRARARYAARSGQLPKGAARKLAQSSTSASGVRGENE